MVKKNNQKSDFWTKLKKPFFCLAPMDQVTDVSFREMFAELGKPDVLFTEFVNVDGLLHFEGKKKLLQNLKFTEKQRPIVAQIWGTDPEKFYKAAKLIKKLKFDGIDINMGCPQSKEVNLGACSALIKNPKLAREIIRSVKKGAGSMPVSVKTRIGFNENIIKDWVKILLECELAAITVHGRTKKEMSKVPANWQAIKEAVKIRDKMKSKTLIVGNGDIQSYQDGILKAKKSGVDGIMIGRASFGNPWVFLKDARVLPINEKLKTLIRHAELFEKWHKNEKPFVIMRKHFKAYVSGFEKSKELRMKLMETKNAAETAEIIKKFLRKN